MDLRHKRGPITSPARLQFTSVRTRQDGKHLLIGLKHTYKDQAGQTFKTEWIEMTMEDARELATSLADAAKTAEK